MQKSVSDKQMNDDVLRVLNEVADPELGIGIVDMGLIYRAEWTAAGLEVDVTTTVRSCPYADLLRDQIDLALRQQFREISNITVQLVFDPPWVLDRLSDDARQALGWSASAASEPLALQCWGVAGARRH
jgi:metal-sulfur cluster biosynthetic enzyme